MQPHRYIMLTQTADADGIERQILVNTAHIATVQDDGHFRTVTLAYGRVIRVSEHWDDFQGFLDNDAPH